MSKKPPKTLPRKFPIADRYGHVQMVDCKLNRKERRRRAMLIRTNQTELI